MNRLQLDLLGGFELRSGPDAPLVVPARKAVALLAYLALRPGRPATREHLAGLFWDGSTDAQARTSLRQVLAGLRRCVPGFGGALCATGDALALRPGWATTDVEAFEAAADAPDGLARAAALYRGELLADLHVRSAGFEAWLVPERQRLHARAIAAMRALLDSSDDAGGHDGSGRDGSGRDTDKRIGFALRLLRLDPAQEEVHRALMRLHLCRGRRDAALRQYQSCRDALRRELDVEPDGETEQLARDIRTRRVLPPPGAAPPPAAPGAAHGGGPELRYVTVLQAELDRRDNDPETLRHVQAALFGAVSEAAGRHGGIASSCPGTVAVAVFGATVAHTDDVRRGVCAALAVHAQAGPGAIRVGIACGMVVASENNGAGQPALAGNVFDQVRRLAACAEAGGTAASAPVRDAVPDQPWDPAPCPGGEQAWRMRPGAVARHSPAPAPFVGRRAELEQFAAVLADLRGSGRGRVVAVRGEAGLGKTRLVEQVRRAAAQNGVRCHVCRFTDFGPDSRCGPVRELLRSILGGASTDGAAAAAARTLVAGGRVAPGDEDALRDVLGLPPLAAAGAAAVDHAAREGARREVIGLAVQAAGASAPRLLIAEDLHWADRRAATDLDAVAAAVPDARVVLVLTTRDRGAGRMSAAPQVTLDLGPLRPEEAESLAASLRDAADPLVRGCLDRAGGNPLFLEQLLRGAWREGRELPATVHCTVLARLDGLAPPDRAALQAASVLGPRFPGPLLNHVLDGTGEACASLVAQALLRPCRDGYLFTHAVVQDAVYASLLRTPRRRWHLRAADWFAGRDPALRAEHLHHAGEHPAAALACLEAARSQAAAHRFDTALDPAERGTVLAATQEVRHAAVVRGSGVWTH